MTTRQIAWHLVSALLGAVLVLYITPRSAVAPARVLVETEVETQVREVVRTVTRDRVVERVVERETRPDGTQVERVVDRRTDSGTETASEAERSEQEWTREQREQPLAIESNYSLAVLYRVDGIPTEFEARQLQVVVERRLFSDIWLVGSMDRDAMAVGVGVKW